MISDELGKMCCTQIILTSTLCTFLSVSSLKTLNFASKPETLGKKKGAAFGFLGGSFGLLRDWKDGKKKILLNRSSQNF